MTCNYRGCKSELPEGHQFKQCDQCRFLDMRDRVAIILDPFAPNRPAHAIGVIQDFVTRMTGEEYLRFVNNQEFLYLESKKLQLLYMPKSPTKGRVKLSLEEQIEEARQLTEGSSIRTKQSKKRETVKMTTIQKQMKKLGCIDPTGSHRGTIGECLNCRHKHEAKRIFNDDFGDL